MYTFMYCVLPCLLVVLPFMAMIGLWSLLVYGLRFFFVQGINFIMFSNYKKLVIVRFLY